MASSAVALGVEEQFFFDILPDSYVTTECSLITQVYAVNLLSVI